MKKKLYVALDDAMWPRITVDAGWGVKQEITEADALEHITPRGLEQVMAGQDMCFTDKDQSCRELKRLFA